MTTWPVWLRPRMCSWLRPTHCPGSRALLTTIAILTLASAAPSLAAPPPTETSGGYWLLDTAWNQAATLTQAPTRADATELVCLLQAATRLDPRLAEAWRQLYDLQSGLGRTPDALQALARYIELAPDDEPALLTFVGEQLTAGQTAEQRQAVCNTWLSRKNLPPAVAGFLHRTLAEIQINRLQNDQALLHAREAVRLFPYDLAAQRLLLDLSGRKGPAAELQLALWSVRRNPADISAIVQVAALLDALGLYEEAAAWYSQSQEVLTKLEQSTTPLGLRMVEHYLDAGQPDLAVSRLSPLSLQPYPPVDVWLLLSEARLMQGNSDQARQVAVRALRMVDPTAATQTAPATESAPPATSRAGSIAIIPSATPSAASAPASSPATRPVSLDTRVQADWIRIIYLGQAADVLGETQATFDAYPDQLWARRTHGWALLQAGQPGKAVEVLAPAAPLDAWSALGLAQAQYELKDKPAAADALRMVQRAAPSGAVWRAAKRWSKHVNLPTPAADEAQLRQARALLADFNKALLRLPLKPGEFLHLKVTMDPPPAAGAPWFGRIDLTNISDQPIYCSADGGLMPNVLVSAMVYDPASRDIGQRLLVSLFRQFILAPKQTVTLYRPLDSGPLRQFLRNPYRNVTVIFTAILDPIRSPNGAWQTGPIGVIAEPATDHRQVLPPAKDVDFAAKTRSGSQADKIDLARRIACVLVGLQDRGAAQTQPAAPSAATLEQAMAALLQDADPTVAAHALAQANYVPLTPELAKAAAPQVNDDHWLDRLMAIRLFAHKQADKFTRALSSLSTADPDPLVRQLAAAYYAAFQAKAVNKG